MQKISVLSLFDGISAGRLALDRAGIQVDKYYASEIDKYAIQVSQKNWPDIIQIGDVTKVKGADYSDVDLLIGGSPCQGFSLSGKQLNFDDPRSKLFFEYVRILKEIKPKYFLLENVRMKSNHENVISEILGVEPMRINSSLVSCQSRNRLYWTNILQLDQIPDKGLHLNSVLENVYDYDPNTFLETVRKQVKQILSTSKYQNNFILEVDKNGRPLVLRPDRLKIQRIGRIGLPTTKSEIITCLSQPFVFDGKNVRKVTHKEAERLQTFDDEYTEGLSSSQRYKCLGNSWTVDIISYLFKGLK